MALQTSGAISLANVQTEFGGVNPISISEYYGKAAGIPASGTISLSHFYGKSNGVLTLKEVVFNASGTFTMPANVVNNQIIVGCTGGGGGGSNFNGEYHYGAGGGGSGRTSGTFTLAVGQQVPITVGSGGSFSSWMGEAGSGGTSSFGGYISCSGGSGGNAERQYGGLGVSGGGRGGAGYYGGEGGATSSSCGAILTLNTGAVDGTTGLYTAKSYGIAGRSGGGGCYGNVTTGNNTGGGGTSSSAGGSGKVVIYYYAMV